MINWHSLINYGRTTKAPKERRLKENHEFRNIIAACIDLTDDMEDMLEDIYRVRRFRNHLTKGKTPCPQS